MNTFNIATNVEKRFESIETSSSNGNLDKYELRIMDKIENRDKSNQSGFASTSSILLKINDFTTNCKEAYE